MLKKLKLTEVTEDIKKAIEKIQKEVSDNPDAEGCYELYDGLYVNGYCCSYSEERIYYVAYTLAKKGINFSITGE